MESGARLGTVALAWGLVSIGEIAMPLYRFYFINNTHSIDGGALDLADDHAARLEAELEAFDLRGDLSEGDWGHWTIRVTDEAGRIVTSIPPAELLPSHAD